METRKSVKGLLSVYFRNCLIKADDLKDKEKVKALKQTIDREESKRVWYTINRVRDNPKLRVTPRVQKVVDGVTVDLTEKEAMDMKIQEVT